MSEKILINSNSDCGEDYQTIRSGSIKKHEDDGKKIELGEKNISFFGGVSLLVNSMTGPALLSIPVVVSVAGWLTPVIVVVAMWLISTFSSWALCEAMSKVPGNSNFQGRVELTSLVKQYFGKNAYFVILMILNVCLLSLNVASIIATAQSLDFAILSLAKETCGWQFYPNFGLQCVTKSVSVTPFGDVWILSPGMVAVLLVIVPLGYVNLNNNIIVQEGAFVSILCIVTLWTVDFIRVGSSGNLSVWESNQKRVLGTVMFNFVVAAAVPSWINEKSKRVSAKKVTVTSTAIASMIFIYVGLLGAHTFKFPGNSDLLTAIGNCRDCLIVTRLTAYYLPIAVFLTSIPVYSIIVKYNLVENKICGKGLAFFISVIIPWLFGVIFYSGDGLVQVINWASLFLQSSINFILPMVLYIKSRQVKQYSLLESPAIIRRTDGDDTVPVDDDSDTFRALPRFMHGSILAAFVIILVIISVIFVTVLNVI